MKPEELEALIELRGKDVEMFKKRSDEADTPVKRYLLRECARRAVEDVASLVAMRAPETVERMERERGLV